ncbi:hypothetical protein BB559_003375 [Furculomyces boomerangus]|uniref:THO complex subunit 1 n=2 Tax=Harpellales TaxID=61421 RepID=A0A2T9YLP2_9FUNG|nr:hypothetical protein BB559_003375 [Furculomyces boomerangus]PWA00434.1 hypothetical protein BB558_003530 [Smittium angustum]
MGTESFNEISQKTTENLLLLTNKLFEYGLSCSDGDLTTSEVYSFIESSLEGSDFWKEYLLQEPKKLRIATSLLEIALENLVLSFTNNVKEDVMKLDMLFDLVTVLVSKGYMDQVYPFSLLESLMESSNYTELELVFETIVEKKDIFNSKNNQSLVSTSGKGQVLLRLLNNLLKRIPKSIPIKPSSYYLALQQKQIPNKHASAGGEFRGKVAKYLAGIFSINERSGINLKGEFDESIILRYESNEKSAIKEDINIDTDIAMKDENGSNDKPDNEKTEQIDDESKAIVPGVLGKRKRIPELSPEIIKFHQEFWGLQEYFMVPGKVLKNNVFDSVTNTLKVVILKFADTENLITSKKREMKNKRNSFEELYYTNQIDTGNNTNTSMGIGIKENEPEMPIIYLTNPILFKKQFFDPRFRCQILIQIVIFCEYLITGTKENVEKISSTVSNKSVLPQFEITEGQAKLLNEIRRRALFLLESKNMSNGELGGSVLQVMRSENAWVNWKNGGCKKVVDQEPTKWVVEEKKLVNEERMLGRKLQIDTDGIDENEMKYDLGEKIEPKIEQYLDEMTDLIQSKDLVYSEEKQAKFEQVRWKAIRTSVFDNFGKIRGEPSRSLKELRE